MKQCKKCGGLRPLSEFRVLYNGYRQSYCHSCEIEKARLYYWKNPEKCRARRKKWREEHPEENKMLLSKWRANNKDKMSASHKDWIRRHREEVRAYQHDWGQKNPDKVRDGCRKRRAFLAQAEGSFTDAEFQGLVDKYSGCLVCGTRERLEADHVIPITKGGSNYITNIQPLCKFHNDSKHNKIIDYRPKLQTPTEMIGAPEMA